MFRGMKNLLILGLLAIVLTACPPPSPGPAKAPNPANDAAQK